MITPIVILALLTGPLCLARVVHLCFGGHSDDRYFAMLGLCLAFAFFGLGHFVKTAGMIEMLPPFVPFKEVLVYLTGLLEFGLALGLLFPQYRRLVGGLCIAVLIGFFPVNVYAAFQQVGLGGHVWGPEYLLIRAPLQLLLIGWTYWFVVREEPWRDIYSTA